MPAAFAQPNVLGPVTSQAAFFQQALGFLTALAASCPLVLLLDDLHWSDPASLDLLRFLARSLDAWPVLLIATYRADELTRRHPLSHMLPFLVREARATRLDLPRLDAAAVRSLVAARYPLDKTDSERLVSYLHERAEGNPFFIGELLRTLEAAGIVQHSGKSERLGDLTHVRVPPLLRQVIDGRLARLSRETQHLLTVAAIIGQEAPLPLWATVADANEERLSTACEEAIEARIVESGADDGTVRFVHALIREALYEGVVPVRRRGWHRRVGEALIAGAIPDPDAVAYHFQRAGDARATEWLIKAGDRARAAWAWLTAAERYEAAVARMRAEGSDAATRGWLLYRISRARRWDDAQQSVKYLDEAEQEGEVGGDAALVALARFMRGTVRYYGLYAWKQGFEEIVSGAAAILALPTDEQARLAPYYSPPPPLAGLKTLYSVTGHFAEAAAIAERWDAADASSSGERHRTPAHARSSLGSVAYLTRGQPREAIAASEQERAGWEAAADYHQVGWNRVLALEWALVYRSEQRPEHERLAREGEAAFARAVGVVSGLPPRVAYLPLLLLDGHWAEAHSLLSTLASVSDNLTSYVFATKSRGTLARMQGEIPLAWEQVRNVLPDGPDTPPGFVSFLLGSEMQRLAAALTLDAMNLPTARMWLEAHDRWLDWNDAVYGRSEGHALWARYHRLAGEDEAARRHAEQALAHATEPRQPLALIAAHRLLGELATEARRFDDAMVHIQGALALADACAAPHERALTLLALVELRATTGDPAAARTLLEEVRAICVPLGAMPAIRRVDALERRLGMGTNAAPMYPAGLSAREVEVLRLIAAGQTNRQIAATLFLSPGTVGIHVTHILTKTATTNRAEAAAFALRQGLA